MPDPCWTCSDNHMDDMVYTLIEYGGNLDCWMPKYNESVSEQTLYPREGIRGITLCDASGGTAKFDFLGQQVAVYGPEFSTVTKSTYSIDGKVVYTRTAQGVGVGVRFFQSDVLPAGTHTLFIDVVEAGEDHPFALDWIEYNNTARETSQIATSSSTDPGSSSQSQNPSSVPSALSASGASKTHVSVAAIAGGVAGGLIALTSVILAYMALRSRRRWRMRNNTEYSYGEVAQYETDTLAIMTPETGPRPVITITGAEDTASTRSVGRTSETASSRRSLRASSVEPRTEPERLGRGMHSESPPAYTP